MPRIPDYTELWTPKIVYCQACGTVFKAAIVVPPEQQRDVYPQAEALAQMPDGIPCRMCGIWGYYRVAR